MPRSRTPLAKARVAGAVTKNPGRYAGRTLPKSHRPIGLPYAQMTDRQKVVWRDFSTELPWLNGSHRVLLRLACIWIARMDEGEISTSGSQVLSAILSKLGATPVDENRINHGDDGEQDESDKFFGSAHGTH